MALELPMEALEVEAYSPRSLVLYAPPKMGKTSCVAQLPNCLILDLENGATFVKSMRQRITSLDGKEDTSLENVLIAIYKAKKPYKYLAVDTITKLEDWVEEYATRMYKASTKGKTFEGSSVLELAQGAGYMYLRIAMKIWLEKIGKVADRIILIGHLKEKISAIEGREVSSRDIDLTGRIKSIVCSDADAVAYLSRDESNNITLNFRTSEELVCGARPDHLKGQIITLTDPSGKCDWSKVYID